MTVPTYKALYNPTGSPVTVTKMGFTIDPSEERQIEVREYPDLVQDDVFDELTALIDSGDLEIRDQFGTISDAQEAKDFILYPHFERSTRFETPTYPGSKQFVTKTGQKAIEESFPTILKDNVSVRGTTRNLNFIGADIIVADNPANERVDVSLDIPGVTPPNYICCRTAAILVLCRTECNILECRT